jgi:hydroxymethylpyrimidine/phosphomethylpyrimidine kinase
MPPVALTIAGSDPSGGAGLQADLKTFHQFGVYGEAVITLLTVQNSLGVSRLETLPADLVAAQIEAVLDDIPPVAIKTGALGSAEVVCAVARVLARIDVPLVVDPVMISKHGASLASDAAVAVMKRELLPRATLITPNGPEAEALSGIPVRTVDDMRRAAAMLCEKGIRSVLVKGGHVGDDAETIDVLYDGREYREFRAQRIRTPHTHGTGCTYSAAITAGLALGLELGDAVERGRLFVQEAIRTAPGLGHGCGPLNHHAVCGDMPV